MKKILGGLFILSIVLIGCSSEEKAPFEAIAGNMVAYIQAVIEKPELKNDNAFFKEFFEKQKMYCEELAGQTIPIEIEGSLGLELEAHEGKIGKGSGESTISVPVNIDLRVTDAEDAFKNVNDLMVLVCDKEGNDLDVLYLGSENNLGTSIAETDTIAEIVDIEEVIKKDNPYKEGEILHKGVSVDIDPLCAQIFVNASKLVIVKNDSERKSKIKDQINAIKEETTNKINRISSSTEKEESIESKTEEFVLDNGKLGPIQIGCSISDLSDSVDGLYDKFTKKKEVHENDMDGEWTEEYLLFTKDGKAVIRTDLEGQKINSIVLEEGSSFIKTSEGINVGFAAKALFKMKKMQWETYYEGTTFATSGHYTYYVNSDDLQNTDIPTKASDFKSSAKIMRIIYR